MTLLLDDSDPSFDEVVIATHSDQALKLLEQPRQAERVILGAIPYQRNEAMLHSDASVMPRRRSAWASWNYHLTSEPTAAPPSPTTSTGCSRSAPIAISWSP